MGLPRSRVRDAARRRRGGWTGGCCCRASAGLLDAARAGCTRYLSLAPNLRCERLPPVGGHGPLASWMADARRRPRSPRGRWTALGKSKASLILGFSWPLARQALRSPQALPEGRQLAQQLRPTAATPLRPRRRSRRLASPLNQASGSVPLPRAAARRPRDSENGRPRPPEQRRGAARARPDSVLDPSHENAIVVREKQKEADVCLDLPAPAPPCLISRRHASLRRDGASWFVADLGSLSGVSVNDARLHQERQIRGGRRRALWGRRRGSSVANARRTCSVRRRSSLLKTPSAKKRRVEPPTNHALDASNAACSAALAARQSERRA